HARSPDTALYQYGSSTNPLISIQSVPSKFCTTGKTSIPVSSDFTNGMTLSSTERTVTPCTTLNSLLVCSSTDCSLPSGVSTCSHVGKSRSIWRAYSRSEEKLAASQGT